jgi:hypothetical protein
MPLAADKPLVKGTTRVSYNDRKLVRMLYSADKNSRQVKQRRKRELTQEDRDKLSQTPFVRAEKAFREWCKKARSNEQLLEVRDSDDRLAMRAMSSDQWDSLVDRAARMQSLHGALEAAAGNSAARKRKRAARLLQSVAQIVECDASDDVPLLTGRKHIRCLTFRRRRNKKSALLQSVPALRRPLRNAAIVSAKHTTDLCTKERKKLSSATSDADINDVQRTVCEPVPTADYDDHGRSGVFYICHACQEPVCANSVFVQECGAQEALFFHSECVE